LGHVIKNEFLTIKAASI